MNADLNFNLLDDLALAVGRKRVNPTTYLATAQLNRLGPLLELAILDRSGLLPLGALPMCSVHQALYRALDGTHSGRGVYASKANTRVGFISTARNPYADDQAEWTAFCLKGQEAAESSALSKSVSQGLIGALREIEDNVHLHSGRAHDGIVGFRATPDEFEFVVSDSGVGILNSLRRSSDYKGLRDAGTAIRLALTDGQSRLRQQDPNRGSGFRSLFVGLANLDAELRFRSDDHAVTIDGTTPSLVSARLSQKVALRGFVASIVCLLKPRMSLQ